MQICGCAAYREVGCYGTRSRFEEGRLSRVGAVEPEGRSRPAKPGCSQKLPTQPRADAEAGRRYLRVQEAPLFSCPRTPCPSGI